MEDVYYHIPPGTSVLKIQNDLFKLGLEPIYGTFILRLVSTHQLKHIRAGEYHFEAGITPLEILYKLTHGVSISYKLTIPEGLTAHQIIQRINKNPHLTGVINDIPPEGSLLPTTLHYNKGQSKIEVIKRLQHMMAQKLASLCAGFTSEHLQNPFEVLVMASIVERESSLAKERPLIASVFLNRLRLGMKLQADPCIIYATTKGRTAGGYTLKKADLMIDSPYNVYKYHGLPPTPICCPGEAALQAVINPPTTKNLFFVVTGNGGHRFSTTYTDHVKNIQLWKNACRIQQA